MNSVEIDSFLRFETVADSFDRNDMAFADFLTQFADMHVDGAVADDDLRAPDLRVDRFARNQLSGR